ncbi:putative polysaccharide biosynthesis protein [Ornithinibacillus halotolerans]|uniref:Membrane protein YabM n=1 Tax=Ornithinibacillus halotolerans TaxID=1274357 RepID=A0A916W6R3_9BACI|nr:polysaccharide biosynthesis protein [Ornithinibacillus halotolerans]GGA70938.1 putative membrane protein YabM [Ornithinibacillus halotolerans]
METNKFVQGALILTLAGLISKILSAGYRIPLQNLTGDIGFYIYQQVYPILGIALVLSIYGFPTAISKLVAEKEELSIKYFVFPIWIILFVISSLSAILLFVYAEEIALYIGDSRLISAYQLASIVLLIIPFTTLLRGIFQGKSQMKPLAYSQIGEQLIRVSIIIAIAIGVANYGLDVYWIGTYAGIASIIGALVASLILVIFLRKTKYLSNFKEPIPWKYYVKTIVSYGIIASLSHLILLIIQFADSFTVVPGLIEKGLSIEEAMEQKGVFDRGQPLIQIGAVVGSSFGLALIPSLAKGNIPKKFSTFNEDIVSSIKISFYLAWGASVGLVYLFPHINILLYQDSQGTQALTILMVAVFLSAIVITASSILQGVGHIKWTAVFILLAFALKWLLNHLLVPHFGIIGSSIGTVISLLFLVASIFLKFKKSYPNQRMLPINWRAFIAANICMVAFLIIAEKIIYMESLSRGILCIVILMISFVGAIIYLYVLIRLKAFSNKELSLIPLGSKLKGIK